MKTLIVGDIHNKIDKAEKIVQSIPHDHVYFLGDYYDNFGDDWYAAKEVSKWLKWSLEQPNRTHLIGNHDVPYINPQCKMGKYGWDTGKQKAVDQIMPKEYWRKMKFHAWVDGWLLSHAGIHRSYFQNILNTGVKLEDLPSWLDEQSQGAWEAIDASGWHWYFAQGESRGGHNRFGGLLWLDFISEFSPILGLNQIVGHTRHLADCIQDDGLSYGKQFYAIDTMESLNYCIDNGLWCNAILEDGKVTVIGS